MSKTAFITGASSGLGAEFARQLAAQGYDLILTARRAERLQDFATRLKSQHGITVQTLPGDLAEPSFLRQAEAVLADIRDLELLVNNAGFGTVGSFVEVARQKHDAMIQVHITALVRLTHAALPGMLARRKGHIINVSSVAGILPLRSELYGASKSFGITFSEALQSQLNGSGVKIQALCPGFTITEFHETPEYQNNFQRSRIPSFAWLNAEQVVRASLASLSCRGVICVPGFLYKLIVLFAKLPLSGMLIRYIGARFIR